jgi:hypothetical protein
VMWDQRGEDKTFQKTRPTNTASMTVDRKTQGGIEVAEYLRTHLRKKQDRRSRAIAAEPFDRLSQNCAAETSWIVCFELLAAAPKRVPA